MSLLTVPQYGWKQNTIGFSKFKIFQLGFVDFWTSGRSSLQLKNQIYPIPQMDPLISELKKNTDKKKRASHSCSGQCIRESCTVTNLLTNIKIQNKKNSYVNHYNANLIKLWLKAFNGPVRFPKWNLFLKFYVTVGISEFTLV